MYRLAWMILVVGACSGKPSEPPPSPNPSPASPRPAPAPPSADAALAAPVADVPEVHERKVWTPRMDDAATFETYSEELGGERFAKFVLDTKTDAIYYFDVNLYKVHKDFIFQGLWHKERTKEANRIFDKNYGPVKPDFMMCYLVHHLAADLWTFAFWDGDLATAKQVAHAYQRMKETFYLGDKVRFRPDSSYQETIAKEVVKQGVPVLFNNDLYQAADYQAFNTGIAIGMLRHIPPGVPESELTFGTDEIVVIHAPLSDITPVAGIISETFSTPLSHPSLRAKAWGIPNIGLRKADEKLGKLTGKIVYFEAKGGEYILREATSAEIVANRDKAQPHVVVPKADLAIEKLATLDEMRAADVVAYGTKASNLGEIVHGKLAGFAVPPGFGVPFHDYQAHLVAHGLDKQVDAMLADPAFAKDPAVRKAKLAALKQAIVAAPVSAELRGKVEAALAALPGSDGGVFVRSSTNAEDLPDFNGAGLYDTVPNMRGTDQVTTAIKTVWASVWNFAAYEDRQRAHIDHHTVFGGVLVQVGVDATAAGVLVTTHPTDPSDDKNYTINAKSGLGMSVVDGKKVPESLIVSWYNGGIRVLSRSDEDTKLVFDDKGGVREVPNPDKGKPVLTNQRARQLALAARRITRLFKNDKLDIEWVFAGDDLYIVQTRPLVQ